jgi:hypothetical protein
MSRQFFCEFLIYPVYATCLANIVLALNMNSIWKNVRIVEILDYAVSSGFCYSVPLSYNRNSKYSCRPSQLQILHFLADVGMVSMWLSVCGCWGMNCVLVVNVWIWSACLYVGFGMLNMLLKERPTNAPVVYPFSLIYLCLHVSVVIRPSSGCSILKSTMSYNVCFRPRYTF